MIESICFADNYGDAILDWLQAVSREEAWWLCAVKVAENGRNQLLTAELVPEFKV